jgi:hypothetical protein
MRREAILKEILRKLHGGLLACLRFRIVIEPNNDSQVCILLPQMPEYFQDLSSVFPAESATAAGDSGFVKLNQSCCVKDAFGENDSASFRGTFNGIQAEQWIVYAHAISLFAFQLDVFTREFWMICH